MSDKFYVGLDITGFEDNGKASPISRVTIWYDDENAFTAGDDTGKTLEIDCPWATQKMADNILAAVSGFRYQAYSADAANLDPAAELGDGITVGGIYSILSKISDDGEGFPGVSAPGEEELEDEYPYLSPQQRELNRRVVLGQSYYGTKITRAEGLVIEKTDGEAVSAKAVFNSDELSFYDSENQRVLYFDPSTGTYKFTGMMNVSDKFIVDKNGNVTMNGSVQIGGSLTMTGTSNWLLSRYSTNKNATIPDGWSEEWNEAWDNTSTQVWAIYSYNGGSDWTQPMLVQGKDGDRGPTGPSGSDANVPDWVEAYTASAEFDTLVSNEWVISMNLYGTKIFGGAYYDDTGNSKLVLNPSGSASGNADLYLYSGNNVALRLYDQIVGTINWYSYDTPIMSTGIYGVHPKGDWDFSSTNVTGLYLRFS